MLEEYLLALGEGIEARDDETLGLDVYLLVVDDAFSRGAIDESSVADTLSYERLAEVSDRKSVV